MKQHFKKISLGFLMIFGSITSQALTQVVSLSTGINNSTNALIPVNSNDDTWTVLLPGGSTYNAVKCSTGAPAGYPAYSGIDASVRMLSSYTNASGDLLGTGIGGTYTYKTTFSYAACNITSAATITLASVGGDNVVTNLYVNGHAHAINAGFSPFLHNLTITVPVSEIISGTNTVTVNLSNDANSYTGFIMRGDLTITYATGTLTPSFTANATYCSGSTITVDGSASTGAIADYVWTVWECDQYGNVNTAVSEWWSPFVNGAPGVYTIPPASVGGPTMTCGKYYLIKLALQNECNPWSQTTKVIYVACPPTVVTKGSTSTICNGDVGTLNAGIINADPSHSYTLNWSMQAGTHHGIPFFLNIYSGPPASVNVSPTVTTTYYGSVTDNTTGCTVSFTYTITVVNNDPTFSLSVNTANASYFTVVAQANDINANTVAGFTYSLVIEELNASSSPYYQDSGTDAWWDFPTHQFRGFVSTSTGNFTQTPWWSGTPAVGTFLYNHTYRITRGTWNNTCPYKQFSMTITPTKGLDGQTSMVIAEDDNAPDFSYLATNKKEAIATEETEFNIYPNPNTGVFTIETSTADKASIEIYDVLGNKVKAFEQNGFKSTVDLSGYPKGMYMINVITNGKKVSKKIIVE